MKQSASDAFNDLLGLWASRGSDGLSKFKTFFDEDFTGFGTARSEVFKNIGDILAQFEREVDQLPDGFSFTIDWINETKIQQDVSVVNCEFQGVFNLNKTVIEVGPVRVSSVWYNYNGRWKVKNWHGSTPDMSNEEEVFPGSLKPKRYEEVSILFTDFIGFTQIASSIPAKKLVEELNELFSEFDGISKRHKLEKIKTIGDSYMLAGGLNDSSETHALDCVAWSIDAFEYLKKRNETSGIKWEIRIGIHTGAVIGGIIGKEKRTFDLWGDTVNIASRIEEQSKSNRISVSAYTYELIKNEFECEYRGKVEIKDKGTIDIYIIR